MDIDELLLEDGEDFLEHYGIKGMHWGVRRNPGPSGRVEGSDHPSDTAKTRSVHSPGGLDGDKNTSTDHERVTAIIAKAKKQGFSSLSNEEIRMVNKRFEDEKKFRQTTREAALARRSTGRKIVDSLLNAGVEAAQQQAANSGKKIVKKMMEERLAKKMGLDLMDPKEAAKAAKAAQQVGNMAAKTAGVKTSAFKVNKNKVVFTPTVLNGVARVKP
jgi:hypothetical protein